MILDLRKAAGRVNRPHHDFEEEWRDVPGWPYEWSSQRRLRKVIRTSRGRLQSPVVKPGHKGNYKLYRRGEMRIVRPDDLDILCGFKEAK